ncbi:MAG: cupin domain-containing protein [Candidatus Cloacimonadaceae bacterium]|nr:cupin domain-containing protein [Candidatus Cloacimonadaceae bacterium]
MKDYKIIIDKMNLIQHPEGGYYRRNWQSLYSGDIKDSTEKVIFPQRRIGSSIIYLLPSNEVAIWHRVNCDEMWHFYGGSPLMMHILSKSKGLENLILGPDVLNEQSLQVIVPRLTWFSAEVIDADSYSLCGCTLWPSFSYTDFEIAEQSRLLDEYPPHSNLIKRIFDKSTAGR